MAGYISARFEKDLLPTSNQVRVIVRNLDEGPVPPLPTAAYFPTDPDELRGFLVLEYVSDIFGENYVRVATLSDITTYTTLSLDTFEDATTDFVSAAVAPGDVLTVVQPDPELWNSEEYPSLTYEFAVDTVLSATQITLTKPLPAFAASLNWTITARSLSGTEGVTRRNGSPAPGTVFRDVRFNRYVANALTANDYVTAVKAGMDTLSNEVTGAGLVDETYTSEPS